MLQVHRLAFGRDDEAALVRSLMQDDSARPWLSVVAEEQGQIVGHVLFTALRLVGTESAVGLSILAPLAVLPKHQKAGIGRRLIEYGCETLKRRGTGLVFVLGDPHFYTRRTFEPAIPYGLLAPYTITPADAWMVRPLKQDLLGVVGGTVVCARSLQSDLASRYGVGRAFSELTKAYRQVTQTDTLRGSLSASEWSKFIKGEANVAQELIRAFKGEEGEMLNQLATEGLLDLSSVMELIQTANGGQTTLGVIAERAVRLAAHMPHRIEVMNRAVTALAEYRLARADGDTQVGAANKAADVVARTQFDYTPAIKARYMSDRFIPGARALFLFKQYAQHMTVNMIRFARQALGGTTEQERSEARPLWPAPPRLSKPNWPTNLWVRAPLSPPAVSTSAASNAPVSSGRWKATRPSCA